MSSEPIKFLIGVGFILDGFQGCIGVGTPDVAPEIKEETANGCMCWTKTTDGGRAVLSVTCRTDTPLSNLLVGYAHNGVPEGTNYTVISPCINVDADDNTEIKKITNTFSSSLNVVKITRRPDLSREGSLADRSTVEFELTGWIRQPTKLTN